MYRLVGLLGPRSSVSIDLRQIGVWRQSPKKVFQAMPATLAITATKALFSVNMVLEKIKKW